MNFLTIAMIATALSQQTTITVTPAAALIDKVVDVRIDGLRAGQQVIVRSVSRQDSATAIVAYGTYVADRRGEVRLRRDASTAGTYTGIDAMGLFWSGRVQPVGSLDVPRDAIKPQGSYPVLISVLMGDSILASTTVTRRFESPDVRVEEVRMGDVVGRLFLPRNAKAPVVIILSGSEGGYESTSYDARILATHGIAAFAQAYFGAPGLPDELIKIPVERVLRGIDYLTKRTDIDSRSISIMASSRGTELALLVAGQSSRVGKVILYGTSVTTGGSLTKNGEPHGDAAWTLRGKPLPIMQHHPSPSALEQFRKPDPVKLRLLFEPGLSDTAAVRAAAIPVENVHGDVMIISGTDDQMGPSDIAGDMVMERLARAGHAGRRVHLKYPNAGHVIGVPFTPTVLRLRPWRFSYGGTIEGYARADADSWPRVIEFLVPRR